MRNIKIAPNEYYHVFNRGVNKQVIFNDTNDWFRFLFLIIYLQSPVTFQNIGRLYNRSTSVQHRVLNTTDVFNVDEKIVNEIAEKRYVELVSFCLMPNHFHLILKEANEGGIARYMQRVLNSYTKYYNTKYEKSGHLFQGPYKVVHIKSNTQLLYVSAYIHRNPRELPGWTDKEDKYFFSSYQDFIVKNRWSMLLAMDIVFGQFESRDEYRDFVSESTAKRLECELEQDSVMFNTEC
jgi:putative transposase